MMSPDFAADYAAEAEQQYYSTHYRCCGFARGGPHKRGCRYYKEPPYTVTVREPGQRWQIVHRMTSGSVTSATYFVSLVGRYDHNNRRLECSCPSYSYGKKRPCKHCHYIANLIGRPELVEAPAEF